jgi:hypothetical protein
LCDTKFQNHENYDADLTISTLRNNESFMPLLIGITGQQYIFPFWTQLNS